MQDKAFGIVLRVLTAVKAAEVEKCVKILDKNEQDVLMKYIYRGFAEPTEGSSAVLLTWHEKVSKLFYQVLAVPLFPFFEGRQGIGGGGGGEEVASAQ